MRSSVITNGAERVSCKVSLHGYMQAQFNNLATINLLYYIRAFWDGLEKDTGE